MLTDIVAQSTAEAVSSVKANKNIIIAPNPYNECLKLFIEQVKVAKEFDFEKTESTCFDLLDSTKIRK
jgi:hypothetical protein